MGGGGLAKMSPDKFLLGMLLVKVNKNIYHLTQGGRGKQKCQQMSHEEGGGESKKVGKKCHVLFEWPLTTIVK